MTTSSSGTSPSQKKFFDLHITGIGYLNGIRTVRPKKGDSFLACRISALNGPSDAVEYCKFDVKVSGRDAQHLIRKCEEACNAERKVIIGFRLGDPWIDEFVYSKGEKQGQPGVSLKARLLYVSFIKIDGELKYKAEPKGTTDAANNEDTAAAAAQDASLPEVPVPADESSDESTDQPLPLAASF